MSGEETAQLKTRRVHFNNRVFADKYRYTGHFAVPTRIRLTNFNKGVLETVELGEETESFKQYLREDCINWFEVTGLTNASLIERFSKEMGLDSLDLRDILTPSHVVKIDVYKERVCFILNLCTFNEERKIVVEHMAIHVSRNVVISFKEGESDIFFNAHEALKENTLKIREKESGLLLAFLLNSFISEQIEAVVHLEGKLEEIEHVLLNGHHHYNYMGIYIQRCRHAHLILKKNILPLKQQFPELLSPKAGIWNEEMLPIYDDLSDQLEYAAQSTDNSRDILTSLVDLYISQNDLRTNAIVKHLTVVATFFIPITFLVGVWGMNFKAIPELDWKYGYLFAWLSCILVVGATWLIMRKKHWF